MSLEAPLRYDALPTAARLALLPLRWSWSTTSARPDMMQAGQYQFSGSASSASGGCRQ